MPIEDYSIEDHTHRFGLWTAARAASTSRFSNSEIAEFLEKCKLKESLQELRNSHSMDHEIYKEWFIQKATFIVGCMSS